MCESLFSSGGSGEGRKGGERRGGEGRGREGRGGEGRGGEYSPVLWCRRIAALLFSCLLLFLQRLPGIPCASLSSPAGAQGRGGEGRGGDGRGGEGRGGEYSPVLGCRRIAALLFSCLLLFWQRLPGIPCASLSSPAGAQGRGEREGRGGEGRGGEGRGGEGRGV